MNTDLNELAAFLYEKDECDLLEVERVFGSGPEVWAQLRGLIKRGEVEVLATGRLQWWGASSPPSAESIAQIHRALKARFVGPTGNISPDAPLQLPALLGLLAALIEGTPHGDSHPGPGA